MPVTLQTYERVASRQANATRPISNPLTQPGEDPEDTAPDARLQALARQLARHGLSVIPLCGDELLLSGVGCSRMAPGVREAWMFLRTLNGRAYA